MVTKVGSGNSTCYLSLRFEIPYIGSNVHNNEQVAVKIFDTTITEHHLNRHYGTDDDYSCYYQFSIIISFNRSVTTEAKKSLFSKKVTYVERETTRNIAVEAGVIDTFGRFRTIKTILVTPRSGDVSLTERLG